ncbi:hypothetical protein C8R46DRAFT_1001914 [Mycena filopes]|nr:hypothetical protein C8R46DRAFT_1001914 [Mycena filopes]
MFPTPTPRNLTLIGAILILLVLYIHAGFPLHSTFGLASTPELGVGPDINGILPIPSRTYVISLARRKDRFAEMERLRTRLGLRWNYVAAEASHSPLVARILSSVRNTTIKLPFQWPRPTPAKLDRWSLDTDNTPPPPSALALEQHPPLTCATEDFTLSPYCPRTTPEYKILSPSRIACWHSHLSAIQRAAASTPMPDKAAALILEDDVDIEADVKERLRSVWNLLPPDWDIVFLGHCWSNESHYPALGHRFPRAPATVSSTTTHLHPSNRPLCTHAYALSPAGAQRLLQHLTYPRFAYSRAIDHALAWLVWSGRLRGFSVVPSVVVQRKIGGSDVMLGTMGSRWRDSLAKGVLES